MANVTVTCDRCGTEIEGVRILSETGKDAFTGGFYNVTGDPWITFSNSGESIVCDKCMFNDPRYIEVYGDRVEPQEIKVLPLPPLTEDVSFEDAAQQLHEAAVGWLVRNKHLAPAPRYIIGLDAGMNTAAYTVLQVISPDNIIVEVSERLDGYLDFSDMKQIVTDLVAKWQPISIPMYMTSLSAIMIERLQDDGLPVHGISYNFNAKDDMLSRWRKALNEEKVRLQATVARIATDSALVAFGEAQSLTAPIEFPPEDRRSSDGSVWTNPTIS